MKVTSWYLLPGQPLPPPDNALSASQSRLLLTNATSILRPIPDLLGHHEVNENKVGMSDHSAIGVEILA